MQEDTHGGDHLARHDRSENRCGPGSGCGERLPPPAGRTGNGRQPRPGELATERTTGQSTNRVAELSDAAVDGLPDQAMRTEVPSLLHLTV